MKIALVVMVILIGGVLGTAFLAGGQLSEALASLKPEVERTPVRVERVSAGKLIATVSAPGEIEPHTKVEISAQVSARIEELPFEEGDAVRKGDVVVRLDDRELTASLEASIARRDGEQYRLQSEQARLQGALTNLRYAEIQLERQKQLHETGDVARKALDDAMESVAGLQANVDAAKHSISVIESSLVGAEAEIQRARNNLDNTVIRAPIDGVIIALNMEVGEQVLGTFNNMGTQIMTIADLDRMLMIARVSENDIADVEKGQSAKLFINAYPDDTFSGVVTHIALQRTSAPDGTGHFRTEIEIDLQGQRIRSGLAANVDIEIDEFDGVRVESQAIVEREIDSLPQDVIKDDPNVQADRRLTPVVYRLIDGEAVCTPVKVGSSDLTHTIVTAGLNPDDVVVIGPYKILESIKHGDKIRDMDAGEDSASDQQDDDAVIAEQSESDVESASGDAELASSTDPS